MELRGKVTVAAAPALRIVPSCRPVSHAPSPQRITLAALASLLVVLLISWSAPESVAYGWGTPVVVGAGGLIWNRLASVRQLTRSLDTAMALLILAPAIAARQQATLLAEWQLTVSPPQQMLEGVLDYCAQATADTAPLLAAGTVGYLVLGGRSASPGLGVLLAAAAASAGCTGALFAAREAAAAGELAQVATLVRGVPWTGFLVIPGAMLGVAFEGRRSRWSVGRTLWFVLAGAAGVYTGQTPLPQLLDTVVVPTTDVLVPQGPLGPTTALAAVPGEPAVIDRIFRERGHYYQAAPVWPCVDGGRGWAHTLRRSGSLALPASAPMARLDAAADRFMVWSTHRLALVGRAAPAPRGPLAPLLAWPTAALLLDRPPQDATALRVGADGIHLIGRARPAGRGCALVPDDDATVDDVWQAVRALLAPAGPCEGIGLVPAVHRPAVRASRDALLTLGCPAPTTTPGAR